MFVRVQKTASKSLMFFLERRSWLLGGGGVGKSVLTAALLKRYGARVAGAAYAFIHYALLVAYMLQGGQLLLELAPHGNLRELLGGAGLCRADRPFRPLRRADGAAPGGVTVTVDASPEAFAEVLAELRDFGTSGGGAFATATARGHLFSTVPFRLASNY